MPEQANRASLQSCGTQLIAAVMWFSALLEIGLPKPQRYADMFLINVKLKQPLRISPAQYVDLDYAVLIAAAQHRSNTSY